MNEIEESSQFHDLSKDASLEIVTPKVDFLFDADKDKLEQALINLIDNSVKYTKKGSIKVAVAKKDDLVVFKITDSGIGIPQDSLDRIGQKFFRAENAVTLDKKGTGLGLFITKSIVEKHGGNIQIESKENAGTTININIPRI